LLFLFIVLLIYHLRCLQRDSASAARKLESRQHAFPTVLVHSGDEVYLKCLLAALRKHAPGLPVIVQAMDKKISKDAREAKAVLLPAEIALEPSKGRNLLWRRPFRVGS
jgi:hypothetical protein